MTNRINRHLPCSSSRALINGRGSLFSGDNCEHIQKGFELWLFVNVRGKERGGERRSRMKSTVVEASEQGLPLVGAGRTSFIQEAPISIALPGSGLKPSLRQTWRLSCVYSRAGKELTREKKQVPARDFLLQMSASKLCGLSTCLLSCCPWEAAAETTKFRL